MKKNRFAQFAATALIAIEFLLPFTALATVGNADNCYIYYPSPGNAQYICPGAPTTQSGSNTGSASSGATVPSTSSGSASAGSASNTGGNSTSGVDSTALPSTFDLQSLLDQLGGSGAAGGSDTGTNDLSANPNLTQCKGTGSLGGSLANTVSGLLSGVLKNTLGPKGNTLLNSVGGVNGILKILQTGNGNVSLSGILGSLTGNSAIGNTIGSLLGGNTSISSILNGSVFQNITGGGLLSSGTSLLSQTGALSSLGSLAPSALSALGLAGGALGALGIGGEVPVSESQLRTINSKIQGNTNDIQTKTDTLYTKTCNQDLAVRAAANQYAAEYAASVIQQCNQGNGGSPCWAGATNGGIAAENSILANTVFNNFISNKLPQSGVDSSILSAVQQKLVADYQNQNNLQTQLTCPVANPVACKNNFMDCPGNTAQEKWNAMMQVIALYPQCTVSGATTIAATALNSEIATRISDRNLMIIAANGLVPQTQCVDASGNVLNVPDIACPTEATIVTAPPVSVNTLTEAVKLGTDKQSHADQIGSLVNSWFAQAAQTAFSSLFGLAGLSQQSTSGSGSYLQQLTGSANTSTITQLSSTLQSNIQDSIAFESTYEVIINQMIADLTDAKNVYSNLQACYADANAPIPQETTVQAVLDTATSTLNTVIEPELAERNVSLTQSTATLTQLQTLDTSLNATQSTEDLNTASDAYQALISSGAVHTSSDIDFANADLAASKITLAGLITNANTWLSACTQTTQ